MTRIPQHHPRDLVALKTAFRLLIDAVGGLEAAHAVTGYPVSRLSEAASPNHADRWPRLDHVAELEAVAGRPLVTAVLAQLAGCTLDAAPRQPGTPGAALVGVVRHAGDVVSCAAAAMSDGRICEAERAELGRQLAALDRAVTHARAVLAGPAADFLRPPQEAA
jgi:hypothetical protein